MRLDYEKLSLDRNGILRSDGDEITHARTIETYLKSIHRTDVGYEIRIGAEVRPIEIEDTAYFVKRVHVQGHHIDLDLSDGTTEKLSLDSLAYGPEGRLIARIKSGTESARFLKSPYYEFLALGELNSDTWSLTVGQLTYSFKRQEPHS